MIRLLADAPYSAEGFGKRAVVDRNDLLLMQIALLPGQEVPPHNANSNVHLLVLEGVLNLLLDGNPREAEKGDLVPVAYGTPMQIRNDGETGSTFLVLKTPHPREMQGKQGNSG